MVIMMTEGKMTKCEVEIIYKETEEELSEQRTDQKSCLKLKEIRKNRNRRY